MQPLFAACYMLLIALLVALGKAESGEYMGRFAEFDAQSCAHNRV